MNLTLCLIWGCRAPAVIATEPIADTGPEATPETTVVVAADTATDDIAGPESPWSGEPGSWLFGEGVVHTVNIEIDSSSWNALIFDPREYAPVTISIDEHTDYRVAIRAKGNTQFRTIDDKPSLVIDFNRELLDQTFDGLPSVYLHNMTYDPTMMHEHLAYSFFREVGVPASRTAYADVTVNGEHYGLYLFVEKQNSVYRERWWSQTPGSMFESGSFNWPCDLDLDCGCFEVDELAEGGEEALQELCDAVSTNNESWLAGAEQKLDWPAFLKAVSAEIVISHYDNYGWNINNFRLYHDPESDTWAFTPWSTDLSFGWYPWSANPHCGEFGQGPQEYNGGYLVRRCWTNNTCRAALESAIQDQAAVLTSMDMPGRIDALHTQIAPYNAADTRKWYNDAYFEREVSCIRAWSAQRPGSLAP